jgi:hypothetical protein
VLALAQFKEAVEAKTGVVNTGRGRMMSESVFMKWARDEGDMTTKEAAFMWAELNGEASTVRDKKGKDQATRLRIPISDDVDFMSSFTAVKAVELTGKTLKKADEKAVAGLAKLAVSDHASLLDSSGFDLGKMGQQLASGAASASGPGASASAHGAFSAKECIIPNVRDLIPEEPSKDKDKDKQKKGEAGQQGGGSAPLEGLDASEASGNPSLPGKRGRFWQGDRATATAQVTAEVQA